MRLFRPRRYFLAPSLALLCALPFFASAAPSPVLQRIEPAGWPRGSEVTVSFHGQHLVGPIKLWTSFAATAVPIDDHEAGDPAVTRFRVAVDTNALPGLGAVRLVTTNGISGVHLVLLDNLITSPSTPAHTAAVTSMVPVPAAADGVCEELQANYYQFAGREGEALSVEVYAQRLGSRLDPLLRVLTSDGQEVAYCDDDPSIGVDSRIRLRLPRTGKYLLELRDINYEGGPSHYYRLRLGNFPLVSSLFPAAGRAGEEISLQPQTSDASNLAPLKLLFPTNSSRVSFEIRYPRELASSYASAFVTKQPTFTEVEPNDRASVAARAMFPAYVFGRFERDGDRDWFSFEVPRPQRLLVRGRTRTIGSPCDLSLQLQNAEGKSLGASDGRSGDDGSLTNQVPAAGSYRLSVEELNGRGGPDLAYAIEIDEWPAFELEAAADTIMLDDKGDATLKINVVRHDFKGEIALAVANNPEMFSLGKTTIGAGQNEINLPVRVLRPLGAAVFAHLGIVGRAQVNGGDLIRPVNTSKPLRERFPELDELPDWLNGMIVVWAPRPVELP